MIPGSLTLLPAVLILATLILIALVLTLRRQLNALQSTLTTTLAASLGEQTRAAINTGFERLQDGARIQADQLARTQSAITGGIGDLSLLITEKLGAAEQQAQASRAQALNETLAFITRLTDSQTQLADRMSRDLAGVSVALREEQEKLRSRVEQQLEIIRTGNEKKLDDMRAAVDEKLQSALEQKIGESFKRVAEQFAQVQQAIGQVQNVASQVSDLKRLFANVKSRGGWGEQQIHQTLEDTLPPGTFEANFRADPTSNEIVEFAVRMPVRDGETAVYLPIDAKFPIEDYDRLLLAAEAGDREAEAQAIASLARRIRDEAKKIAQKYLKPPRTTDIGVLYLPSEGLFAEVARVPGLIEQVQREHRVLIQSPSLLPALLHTIRVGHFTVQLERKAGEIGKILAGVKGEWIKLGETMDTLAKRADLLSKGIETTQVRVRAVGRTLRDIDAIEAEPTTLLPDLTPDETDN